MKIITNEAELRLPNVDVQPDEIDGIIKLLERGLQYSALMGREGVGLAATQIGIHKKAAIIRLNDGRQNIAFNLVNARIEQSYDLFIFHNEGCLSFEGKTYDTMRYQEIYVINNAVEPHSFIATGLLAVVIQHELDHLNGILMTDRVVKKPIKQSPNEKCLCGSGKKFKRCCYIKL